MAAEGARRVCASIELPDDDVRDSIVEAFGRDPAADSDQDAVGFLTAACRSILSSRSLSMSPEELDDTLCEVCVALWSDDAWRSAFQGHGDLPVRCPLREIKRKARFTLSYGDDNSNRKYFRNFGRLALHATMLQDDTRTATYRKAILMNKADFEGKVVMDVGSGTGILAFFAIQAGAARVYCVEASPMADVISQLAVANGGCCSSRLRVVNKVLQEIRDEIPEKVDVILHETLGTFLFAERGIETVLIARERFLKPGGKLYPAYAEFCVAPFEDGRVHAGRLVKAQNLWTCADFHGVDLSSLHERSRREMFCKVLNDQFHPDQLRADPRVKRFDFRTMRPEEVQSFGVDFSFRSKDTCIVHGLAGWFDAVFEGCSCNVVLPTSPWDVLTHWWQTRLMMLEPLAVNEGQQITGYVGFTPSAGNTYTCRLVMECGGIRRDQDGYDLADTDGSHRSTVMKVHEVSPTAKVQMIDWAATRAAPSGGEVLVQDPLRHVKLHAAQMQAAAEAASGDRSSPPTATAWATTDSSAAQGGAPRNGKVQERSLKLGSQIKVGGRTFVSVDDAPRCARLMDQASALVLVASLGQALLMAPQSPQPPECLVELWPSSGGAVASQLWLEHNAGLEHMRSYLAGQQASNGVTSHSEARELDAAKLTARYVAAKRLTARPYSAS